MHNALIKTTLSNVKLERDARKEYANSACVNIVAKKFALNVKQTKTTRLVVKNLVRLNPLDKWAK